MGRKIEIELTDEQEAEALRLFNTDLKPEDVAIGGAGWPNEAAFWHEVVDNGLATIRALQDPMPDDDGRKEDPDPDGLPF